MTGLAASRRQWLTMGVAAAATSALPAQARARRLQLSLNENAFGPSPKVAPAIVRAVAGIERYVDQTEVDALARQIAALEQVSAEQVVLGEVLEPLGLFLARRKPGGGEIVYSTPGYTALIDAAAPLGGKGVPVPLDRELRNDLPALACAIGPQTLALSLVNPHNPSGTVNDRATFDAFIAEASGRTLVVVDEAYIEYDDLAARSAIRHVRQGRNVLVFRTLAKIYGLAGLSIGYAVAPVGLARDLKAAGIGAPHSLSRLALVAASAALADQGHVASVRQAVRLERERYTALFDARGWPHADSRANFVFFKPPDAPGLRRELDRAGIAVGRPFPPLGDLLRITIGRPADNTRVLTVLNNWGAAKTRG